MKVENISPRMVLPKKCDVDGRNLAEKVLIFDFNWKLYLCSTHFEEIKEGV